MPPPDTELADYTDVRRRLSPALCLLPSASRSRALVYGVLRPCSPSRASCAPLR